LDNKDGDVNWTNQDARQHFKLTEITFCCPLQNPRK
jgi:hypothetical protein